MKKEVNIEADIRGTGKIIKDTPEEIIVVLGENGTAINTLKPSTFKLLPTDETREDFIINLVEDHYIDTTRFLSQPLMNKEGTVK